MEVPMCSLYKSALSPPVYSNPPPHPRAELRKMVEVTTNPMRLLSWEIVTWLLGNVVLCITFKPMFTAPLLMGSCLSKNINLNMEKFKGGFSKLNILSFFREFSSFQVFTLKTIHTHCYCHPTLPRLELSESGSERSLLQSELTLEAKIPPTPRKIHNGLKELRQCIFV